MDQATLPLLPDAGPRQPATFVAGHVVTGS
jgi:hypothetical protein